MGLPTVDLHIRLAATSIDLRHRRDFYVLKDLSLWRSHSFLIDLLKVLDVSNL